MATAHVNGADLWYRQSGQGATVVHIHGAGLGHQNFASLTPLMAQHYSVLDFDMRGYGQSERLEGEYSMSVWSDDIAGLLDVLEIETAHVHGTSMGGMVAQQFAIDYPRRLSSLILSCTACKLDYAGWLTFEAWIRITDGLGLEDPTLAMLLAQQGLTREFLDGPEGRTTVERIQTATAGACSPEVFIAACRAMQEIDFMPDLPKIQAPTLVMTGENDQMTPADPAPSGGGSVQIAQLVPAAELVLLPNAGHTHLFEQPDETARVVLAFLDRMSAPAT